MRLTFFFPTAFALAALPAAAFAEDAHAPEIGWHTSAELGAIATSGNTVGASVTGKIDARQELPNWSNEYIFSGYYKEDQNTLASGQTVRQLSAQRVSLSAKSAYKLLDEGEKLFVLATHVDDKFGAYTVYSTMGVGHSSRVYQHDDNIVDLELGPGYFKGTRPDGGIDSGFTIRGAASVRWKLSPSAMFTQTTSVERSSSNVHSSSETALSTKINGTMQMKAAFVIRNDSNVPIDKKKTDTQTSLTLVYSF
jgi:putative salt-induced outer membrane protein YdiY